MADDRKQNRSGKKRSTKRKDDFQDLENRMNAKFAEQEYQYSTLNGKLSQLMELLTAERRNGPASGVSRSESVSVTDEALSAARIPILPLNSASFEQQIHGEVDTVPLCVRQ